MNADHIDPRAESLRDLDRRIIDALVRARANLGLPNRSEFARLLDQATKGAGPDTSTYNKWENGSVRPPAWALVLAAEVSGLSVSALLEEPEGEERPSPEFMARLKRVENRMDRMLPLAEELQKRLRQNHSDSQAAGS